MHLDPLPQRHDRAMQAVPFGREHAHHLPPACHEVGERAGFVVAQGLDRRPRHLREMGQHAGVERIRLGELADGAREVAGLAGIDDRDGESGHGQGGDDGAFVPAAGLDDDQRRDQAREPVAQVINPRVVVGGGPGVPGRPHGDV